MNLPNTTTKFIWHFLRKQKKVFFALLFLHLAWSIDATIMPYAFKIFLEAISNYAGDKSDVWSVIAGPVLFGVFIWVVTEIMFRVYDYICAQFYPYLKANIRMEVVEYVQKHSYRFFSDNFTGSVANKIRDLSEEIAGILNIFITTFIPTIVGITIGSLFFSAMDPVFMSIVLGWFFVHIGSGVLTAKRCNYLSRTDSEARSLLSGKIVDSLSNILTVKYFSRQKYEMKFLRKFQDDEKDKNRSVFMFMFKLRLFHGFACFSMMGVLMTWMMIVKWQADVITSSELVYIFYASWGLTHMAWVSGERLPEFFEKIGVIKQGLTIIEEKHEIEDEKNAKRINIRKGGIEFEDVDFHYEKEMQVFVDKNLKIEAGSKVGLVGSSGSGKTTLVNLILRFFDVKSGRILIDGQDISKCKIDSLREQIAVIPQDPILFHRSLFDNISYGNLNASSEDVIKASKKANCHEFISKLSKGYDTLVGDKGLKLSGGQRQRVAIARAFLKNAPILILDEATSALDSITERHIQEALVKLMKGRTTIIIAHRLSTLSLMDRILVMRDGKVIEDGKHGELVKKKEGHYSRLWRMQSEGFI